MNEGLNILVPLMPIKISWKFLFSQIEQNTAIEELRRLQWKKSVEILQSELGDGFFDTCTKHHPIFVKLSYAPWLLEDLIDITVTLKSLKSYDSNYPILLSKIRPFKKCISEGLAFIEIASKFLSNGFTVKFIEETNAKTPDILLIDNKSQESIYVEVSKITDTDERRQINDEFKVLSNSFLFYGYDLPFSCQQLNHLTETELSTAIRKIHELKDAATTNETLEVYKNEKISLAIAHPVKYEQLISWCEENNQRKGMNGLQINFDDTNRILKQNKIYKKVKQIPHNETGLLILPIQYMYFFIMDHFNTADLIQKEIRSYPNLFGVIMMTSLGQNLEEKKIELNGNILSIKMVNGIARHTLFIINDHYKGNLSEATLERLQNCF